MAKSMKENFEVQSWHQKISMANSDVLINQRCENDVHRFRNNVSHRCKVCGWDFETASSAFCSIECRNTLGSQLDEMMGSLDDVVKRKENSEDVFEPIVKRKHRRKGTPYRSPFY
ncbi:hypothetical protein BRARA_I03417 [Brassica rapa]|uniref:Uncharacterized protein n=1 Tax=Brassica campestris TaxID=3711 RepID=A0A397XZJ0_BRACM|nr:hypothetical protein BRARA_I03417 [Brassica rapa]